MTTPWAAPLLECTTCRSGALGGEGDTQLVCDTCADVFPVADGIARFQRDFDDYSENYDLICEDDLARPKTPTVVKQVFSELVTPRAKGIVCDVGCGDGYVLRRLSNERRIALDIALPYLEALPPEILRLWSRVENVPLRARSVDTLICTDVLEHVLDPSALATEIDRLVATDGAALIAFPFEQDLSVYELPEYRAKYAKYKYVHLRSINDALIDELFPSFRIVFEQLITEGMPLMEFKPFPIKFLELRRR